MRTMKQRPKTTKREVVIHENTQYSLLLNLDELKSLYTLLSLWDNDDYKHLAHKVEEGLDFMTPKELSQEV